MITFFQNAWRAALGCRFFDSHSLLNGFRTGNGLHGSQGPGKNFVR